MSTPLTSAEVIRATRLFRNIDPSELSSLIEPSKRLCFRRGEFVFRQGEQCPGVFVVVSGVVHLVRIGEERKKHLLHFCYRGDSFAEIDALGQGRVSADAIAADRSVCVLIPIADLLAAVESSHAFCRQLLSGMTLWVCSFIDLLDDLVLRDARGRVVRYLMGLKGNDELILTLPSAKKDIANHLNLTGETLSRVLRQLHEEGLVAPAGPRDLQILDIDRLFRESTLDE